MTNSIFLTDLSILVYTLYNFSFSLFFTSVKSINATHSGVLHDILFLGKNSLVRTLAHDSRLVEPTKDQLQFSAVSIYISNGVYPRNIGLVIVAVIYLYGILLNFQPPVSYRPKFW